VTVLRQVLDHVDDAVLQSPMMAKLVVEGLKLLAGGELTIEEQVSDLFEAAVVAELLDVIASIEELAFNSIDSADSRFSAGDAFEAANEVSRVGHRDVSPRINPVGFLKPSGFLGSATLGFSVRFGNQIRPGVGAMV
jgi:hypothetical protein